MAVSGATLLAGAGFLSQVGGGFLSPHNKTQQIRLIEKFKRASQAIQFQTLKALNARQNYSAYVNENIVSGKMASSLSKANIGVSGTAHPAFETILQKYDRERDSFKLQYQEQTAKLAVQRQSSYVASETGADFTGAFINSLTALARFGEHFVEQSKPVANTTIIYGGVGDAGKDNRFTQVR